MIKYVLASGYLYRREWFGGILFSLVDKESRFYNHTAALLIEAFLKPNTVDAAVAQLTAINNDHRKHRRFFEELVDLGTLVAAPSSWKQSAKKKAFFAGCYDFRNDRLCAPLGVELELTLKCMRKCDYCAYHSSPHVSTAGDLTRDQYQRLFNVFADNGVCYLRFTGGDPLTRRDCLDIMEDADSHHFGIAVASDLTLFCEQDAKRLAGIRNLVSLQTTLDGPNQEIADRLRGNGNFHRVERGLDLLAKYRIPVIVGTILTKHNVGSIYETGRYLSRWDVSWCVSPLYTAGRGAGCDELVPDDADLANAFHQFGKAIEEGLVKPADPGWSAIAAPLDSDSRSRLWAGQPWLIRSPDRVIRIDPVGKCYTSIHLKEVFGDEVYVGSIVDDDFLKMWNEAPLLNRLRANQHRNAYFGEVLDLRSLSLNEVS